MPSSPISHPAARLSQAARHARGWPAGQSQASRVRPTHARIAASAELRARLEECWRARLERVTALSLAYHDEAEDAAQAQPGSGARRALLASQAVAERQALVEIEAALDRLSSGRYGWCEQCGRPIAATLLFAQPQVRYCTACAFRSTGKPHGAS